MSGEGLKNSAQAMAMNSQQMMAAVQATPGPPGIRYGRGCSTLFPRSSAKAGKTMRYETRKHRPESLNIIQKTLEALDDMAALPTRSRLLMMPMMTNARWGVL